MNLLCPVESESVSIPDESTDSQLHIAMYLTYHVRQVHGDDALCAWVARVNRGPSENQP